MKILVVADIHSNWAALSAIQESFDACLMLGDVVDYGTDPLPCIDWCRQHADYAIRGNHDHAVAQHVAPQEGGGFRRLARGTRPLHWDLIDAPRMRYLARLPITAHLELDGLGYYLVHATPRDALDEYLSNDPEAWSVRLKDVQADVICVGHTHRPFCLELDGKRVINPGSVGQPRDGDPRAAYAVIENGNVEFRRVDYDIDAALRQMRESGVEPWVTDLSAALLKSGGTLNKEEMDAIQ